MNEILEIKKLTVIAGEKPLVDQVDLSIERNACTAIMGPSLSGKTTLLRAINRLAELDRNVKIGGKVLLDGQNLYQTDAIYVRRVVGMIFRKANPFDFMSVYENVISGYKLNSIKLKKSEKDRIVEESLTKTGLWNVLKDKLYRKIDSLSAGERQKLCFARAIALEPQILLLDEPTFYLSPSETREIIDLIENLRHESTIIFATHTVAEAARVSDFAAFMNDGRIVEYGPTKKLLTTPENPLTEEFLSR